MKKDVSFKMWVTVLFGGLWQFICKIFSWKYYKRGGRFLCICLGVLALFICFGIGYGIYDDIQRNERWVNRDAISNRMEFVRSCRVPKTGWISGKKSREKLLTGIEWVVAPENDDSLAVFSRAGKRGYLNRFTGREAIRAKYDGAWLFSDGIAAVADGDSIRFINEKGQPAFNKAFARDYRLNHVFHGDYCLMGNGDGAVGLIDRQGNWVVEPEYDIIIPAPHNYWKMRKSDGDAALWYAFTDKAEPVNMEGVTTLEINDDLGIIYTLPNHLKMVIDFEGNRQEKFLCQNIEAMYYVSDNLDKDGDRIDERTTLYRYVMSDGYEGLCKANGEIVTEPLYWTITPKGKDLYYCSYKNSDNGVIINSKGEITRL